MAAASSSSRQHPDEQQQESAQLSNPGCDSHPAQIHTPIYRGEYRGSTTKSWFRERA
jgi:hypothetical protein